MKVTKGGPIVFRVQHMRYELTLPQGLKVKKITEGSTSGSYFLDEFPEDMFPQNSFIRHDAEHYGIVLNEGEVEDGN